MTPSAPAFPDPATAASRVRVRWDNVMIVLIGLVAASFAVVAILMTTDSGSSPTATTAAKDAAAAPAPELEASTDAAAAGGLTIDDALSVVEETRVLLTEGRWDEAADRLELVPAELRDASGAAALQAELDRLRGEHETLRAQLDAAVQARNYRDARVLLTKLAALAPLDADLAATRDLVDRALAPKATAGGDGGASAMTPGAQSTNATAVKASTSGGGSTQATKPATSAARPSTSGAKPAASGVKPPASGAKPASIPTVTGGGGGSSGAAAPNVAGPTLDELGIELTPQQEAELAASLEQAMAGL